MHTQIFYDINLQLRGDHPLNILECVFQQYAYNDQYANGQ